MAVQVTETLLDKAARILSGEAVETEKQIAKENGVAEQFAYIPVDLEDGIVFVAVEPDANEARIKEATDAVIAHKAVWTTKYVNDLPDSSFAYIEPGGDKDDDGKTKPRSKRHLPYKDKNGKIDAAHVRNALARLDGTDIPDDAKKKARAKLTAAAKEVGVEVSDAKEKDASAESETVWADPETKRFDITTEETLKESMVAVADAIIQGKLTEPERTAIMAAMGERKKALAQAPAQKTDPGTPVKKDVLDSFSEALDAALDNALMDAVSSVYYAFVRTYAGDWSSGYDADKLTREEFAALTAKMQEAMIAVYDKLADDEDAAAAAQTQAAAIAKHAIFGAISDALEGESSEPHEKAGKRHSKHDESRMEIIHGALVGLGYSGCTTKSDDDGDEKGADDDGDGDGTAKKSVTGKSSTEKTPDPKNVDDAQKRVTTLEAELHAVKAQAETSQSELSRVKDEQQTRITELEGQLQAAQKSLADIQHQPAPDPLTRPAEKVQPEEGETQKQTTGARRGFQNFTREISHR